MPAEPGRAGRLVPGWEPWTPTSSWSGPGSPGWSPPPSSPTRAGGSIAARPGARGDLGGQAFWSFGGLFLVDSPEQRRLGIRDSLDLALQDWLGSAALRPRRRRPRGRGPLGAPVGHGLRRLRGGREARLAARAGRALLPGRRLGRARRPPRRRARQLGAALPRHLGHRARAARAVRAAGAGRRSPRAASSCGSGTAWTADRHRRRGRPACAAPCWSRAPRRAAQASSRAEVGAFALAAQAVIVTSGGIGANHDLVRALLARPARHRRREHMISGVPDARRRAHARRSPRTRARGW